MSRPRLPERLDEVRTTDVFDHTTVPGDRLYALATNALNDYRRRVQHPPEDVRART